MDYREQFSRNQNIGNFKIEETGKNLLVAQNDNFKITISENRWNITSQKLRIKIATGPVPDEDICDFINKLETFVSDIVSGISEEYGKSVIMTPLDTRILGEGRVFVFYPQWKFGFVSNDVLANGLYETTSNLDIIRKSSLSRFMTTTPGVFADDSVYVGNTEKIDMSPYQGRDDCHELWSEFPDIMKIRSIWWSVINNNLPDPLFPQWRRGKQEMVVSMTSKVDDFREKIIAILTRHGVHSGRLEVLAGQGDNIEASFSLHPNDPMLSEENYKNAVPEIEKAMNDWSPQGGEWIVSDSNPKESDAIFMPSKMIINMAEISGHEKGRAALKEQKLI